MNKHQRNILPTYIVKNQTMNVKKKNTKCNIQTCRVFSPVLLWYVKHLLSVKRRYKESEMTDSGVAMYSIFYGYLYLTSFCIYK